jgi:hypothetical protein
MLFVSHTSHAYTHPGVVVEIISHGLAWPRLALLMMHRDWYLWGYPMIWFDARESVVMPFRALLERVSSTRASNVALSHISVVQAT